MPGLGLGLRAAVSTEPPSEKHEDDAANGENLESGWYICDIFPKNEVQYFTYCGKDIVLKAKCFP